MNVLDLILENILPISAGILSSVFSIITMFLKENTNKNNTNDNNNNKVYCKNGVRWKNVLYCRMSPKPIEITFRKKDEMEIHSNSLNLKKLDRTKIDNISLETKLREIDNLNQQSGNNGEKQ